MVKIAVATNDGKIIDEHFGRAKSFQVFEVEDTGDFRFIEERNIIPHCPGDPDVDHSADAAVKQLTDVDAVFVSRIGPGAAKSLEDRGIRAFALSGPVDRALTAYGKRHRLIKGKTPGAPRGFIPVPNDPQTGGPFPGEVCGAPGGCSGCR